MSFGGAECSTAGNPLSQFSKHVQDDKSLQRDRLASRGPNGSLTGFRSAGRSTPQDEMVNSFLQQSPGLPDVALDHGPLGQLRIDPAPHGVHLRAQSASPAWSDQTPMEAAFNMPPGTQFGPDDFAAFRQLTQSTSARATPAPSAGQLAHQRPILGVGLVSAGPSFSARAPPMYHQPMYSQARPMQQEPEGKGKGRIVELDDGKWEEQFAQIELEDKRARNDDESLAMEPELNAMDEAILGETGFGDLEAIWNGIQAEDADLLRARGTGDVDATLSMSEWDSFGDWAPASTRLGLVPQVEEYVFEDDNIFGDHSNPFEEGVRIMAEGGNLSLAALAFEAACQKDSAHVDAWVHLGTAQAQNEKEEAAIRALEHALKLDANNLSALMGLAISYTNEGYDSTAYRTLERWLSVKYPNIVAPAELSSAAEVGFTDRQQLHERITGHFIRAARLSPDGEHMDPDVQVALGVLFYGTEDYDKAVDCFTVALRSTELGMSNDQSQVHLLWNRLGATLANSGRSEDAIAAYEKALSIRPNFVRARYNLGVSCINMGCHEQAAGHLLAALEMHKAVETSAREKAREILGGANVTDEHMDRIMAQNQSATLYDTLRRVFGQMGRRDLAEKVIVGVDPEIFRAEFEY